MDEAWEGGETTDCSGRSDIFDIVSGAKRSVGESHVALLK
jgi:hypothetical protein